MGGTLGARIDAELLRIEQTAETLEAPSGATIKTLVDPASASSGEAALQTITQLSAGHVERFEIGTELGRGGMGVVRAATQRTLKREVAVKQLLDHRREPEAALKMLQEAWITGSLEHPNVVPVYDIGVDPGGQPLIVLKRVQGRPWSELLAEPEQLQQRFAASDVLDWNLRLFMQVCHAIEFAHRRGVLHLDIKPDNVMVGDLGECYLMDWGIAVTTRDDVPLMPRARQIESVIGTPVYFAPEMLVGDGGLLSERTDVYLLGSTLFELAVGRPPHASPTLVGSFHKAINSKPQLPADVPPELAAIVRRAMAREPEQRFPGAEALARAVQEFLDHRESLALAAQAEERLAALRDLLAQEAVAEPEEQASLRPAIYALHSAARFGFEQALRGWPENTQARAGRVADAEAMVRYELRRDDVRAARTLAAELGPVSPELSRELEDAEGAHAARIEELAQSDWTRGQVPRFLGALAMGLVFVARPLVDRVAFGVQVASFEQLKRAPVVFAAVCLVAAFFSRKTLRRSRLTRQFFAVFLFLFAGQVALLTAMEHVGVRDVDVPVLLFFYWATISTVGALTFERRAWPMALGFWAGFVASFWIVTERALLIAATDTIFVANVLAVWWPQGWRGRSAAGR